MCTSSSFSGLNAAALAGLGVTVQAGGVLPPGLTALPPCPALPELGHIEFVLAAPRHSLRGPAGALATAILDNAYWL